MTYHVIDHRHQHVRSYKTWTGAHRHIEKAKQRAVRRGWNLPRLTILRRGK